MTNLQSLFVARDRVRESENRGLKFLVSFLECSRSLRFRYLESTLRRILAALLMLFFVVGPLLPAMAVDRTQSEVPGCCRKDGAHRCSVRSAKKSKSEQSGKPALRAVCPFLSNAVVSATAPQSFVPPSPAELSAGVVPPQLLFSYDVATVLTIFSPGNLQRGPPQLHL